MSDSSEFTEILDMAARALRQSREAGMGIPEVDRGLLQGLRRRSKSSASANELSDFRDQICDCTKCRLHEGRNKFVFGVGNPNADVMFIGEGPGRDEDLKGEPFVGRAGLLLDKILAAIGFDRQTVYIANIVKCRPPNNRDPQPDEMTECMPYLLRQIDIIEPKFICCLG